MQNSNTADITPFINWREPKTIDLEDLSFDIVSSGFEVTATFVTATHTLDNPHKFDVVVSALISHHEAQFHFNAQLCDSLLSKILPGAFLKHDGGDRDLLFLKHAATPFFDALEAAGLPLASLSNLQSIDKITQELARFETVKLTNKNGDIVGYVGVSGSRDFFSTLLSVCQTQLKDSAKPGSLLTRLVTEVALVAGVINLSLSDVKRLKSGQGIIFDIAPIQQNQLYLAIGDGRFLQTQILGTSANVISRDFLKMPSDAEIFNGLAGSNFNDPLRNTNLMAPNNFGAVSFQPTLLNPPVISLQDVPLQVTVEVARYELSVDEISKLRAGSLFAIPEDPKKMVSLRVGNQIIGLGEIVQAGHKLAVRITEMKS